jgi:hypothetical protein
MKKGNRKAHKNMYRKEKEGMKDYEAILILRRLKQDSLNIDRFQLEAIDLGIKALGGYAKSIEREDPKRPTDYAPFKDWPVCVNCSGTGRIDHGTYTGGRCCVCNSIGRVNPTLKNERL